MTTKKSYSISVSRGMYARIKNHTDQTGESIAGFVTDLIDDHIDQEKREPFLVNSKDTPRVYLSCVAPEGEEVDTARDVKLGIGSRRSMPDTKSLRMKVTIEDNKILLTAELYLNELCLDMPATLIDEDGIETEGRITVEASTSSEHALHPVSDFESLRINGGDDIYAKSIELSCVPTDGDHVTKLVVHTIKPRGVKETECQK